MAYHTYITQALVCGTFNRNTADRSYLLFTRELGMLFADARSVREERSKQRFALQDFSLIRVSLVRGKTGWKIGSVESVINFYGAAADKGSRGSVVSVFRFLRRFLRGEEAAPELFDIVHIALSSVKDTMTERSMVEKSIQVKLLMELGYVDRRYVPELLLHAPIEKWLHTTDRGYEPLFDKLIETAVSTSHL